MELAALDHGDLRGMRKVAASLIKEALKGNIAAVKEIADRIDGNAIQQHHVDMEERIASTEDWLKLVGEQQKTLVHCPRASPSR